MLQANDVCLNDTTYFNNLSTISSRKSFDLRASNVYPSLWNNFQTYLATVDDVAMKENGSK